MSSGLSSLLQHHSLKASVLWHSAFFMVQLSHPYMTTGKTTASTIWTFVGKVISLIFNMLSRFAIAVLPRSKLSFNFVAAVTICSDFQFSSVQSLNRVQLCDPMNHSTPGLPVHHQLPEFTHTRIHRESVMPSSHLILCHPFLLLPSILPSIRVFSNELALCIRLPKC